MFEFCSSVLDSVVSFIFAFKDYFLFSFALTCISVVLSWFWGVWRYDG